MSDSSNEASLCVTHGILPKLMYIGVFIDYYFLLQKGHVKQHQHDSTLYIYQRTWHTQLLQLKSEKEWHMTKMMMSQYDYSRITGEIKSRETDHDLEP